MVATPPRTCQQGPPCTKFATSAVLVLSGEVTCPWRSGSEIEVNADCSVGKDATSQGPCHAQAFARCRRGDLPSLSSGCVSMCVWSVMYQDAQKASGQGALPFLAVLRPDQINLLLTIISCLHPQVTADPDQTACMLTRVPWMSLVPFLTVFPDSRARTAPACYYPQCQAVQ